MPRLSENEAREFLSVLGRVEADMTEAMSDSEDLTDNAFEEKWGAPASQIEVEAGRGNYLQFVEHAYLSENNESGSEVRLTYSEGYGYSARHTESGVASQGETEADALRALAEALTLHQRDFNGDAQQYHFTVTFSDEQMEFHVFDLAAGEPEPVESVVIGENLDFERLRESWESRGGWTPDMDEFLNENQSADEL